MAQLKSGSTIGGVTIASINDALTEVAPSDLDWKGGAQLNAFFSALDVDSINDQFVASVRAGGSGPSVMEAKIQDLQNGNVPSGVNFYQYTVAGSYTYTPHANAALVYVLLIGGGGSGSTVGNGNSINATPGGGAGAAEATLTAANLASSYAITVGNYGNRGNNNNVSQSGGSGGTSNFGGILTANGGGGGSLNGNTSNGGNATSNLADAGLWPGNGAANGTVSGYCQAWPTGGQKPFTYGYANHSKPSATGYGGGGAGGGNSAYGCGRGGYGSVGACFIVEVLAS